MKKIISVSLVLITLCCIVYINCKESDAVDGYISNKSDVAMDNVVSKTIGKKTGSSTNSLGNFKSNKNEAFVAGEIMSIYVEFPHLAFGKLLESAKKGAAKDQF